MALKRVEGKEPISSKVVDLSGKKLSSLDETVFGSTSPSVDQLRLGSNSLTSLPWQNLHVAFPNIRVLQLSKNSLNSIPGEISLMVNLEKLDLSHNKIQSIEPQFSGLGKLRKLDLSSNGLETVPESVSNLPSLEILILCKNQIHSLPTHLAELSKLEVLELAGNPLISPPVSIINKGCPATLNYLRNLSSTFGGQIHKFRPRISATYNSTVTSPNPFSPDISKRNPKTIFKGCREYMEDRHTALNHVVLEPPALKSRKVKEPQITPSQSPSPPADTPIAVSASSSSAELNTPNPLDSPISESPTGSGKTKKKRKSTTISTLEPISEDSPISPHPTKRKSKESQPSDADTVATEDANLVLNPTEEKRSTDESPSKKKSKSAESRSQARIKVSSGNSSEASEIVEDKKESSSSSPKIDRKSSAGLLQVSDTAARPAAFFRSSSDVPAHLQKSSKSASEKLSSSDGFGRSMAEDVNAPPSESLAFFAVYDGHAGARCSEYLKHHLHEELFELSEARKGEMPVALHKAFLRTEKYFAHTARQQSWNDGSTAVVALIHGDRLIVGHVGDSRAVLCRGKKAVPLTSDHKPDRPDEEKRIEAAGGSVLTNTATGWIARVNGHLAVSRAFGDAKMKEPQRLVSTEPEITVVPLNPSDQFVILASDGLWDVCTNQEAVDVVRKYSDKNKAAEYLTKKALKIGTTDNITVIIVWLTWAHDIGIERIGKEEVL